MRAVVARRRNYKKKDKYKNPKMGLISKGQSDMNKIARDVQDLTLHTCEDRKKWRE